MSLTRITAALLLIVIAFSGTDRVIGDITSAHKREISALNRDVTKAATSIRKKEFDEAETALDEVQQSIERIAADAGVEISNRAFRSLINNLNKQRDLLSKAKLKANPDAEKVDFLLEVAPIIVSRCTGCHGAETSRASLRLDTFAGWQRGGQSGPIIVPGRANASMMAMRLSLPEDRGRMPASGAPLTQDEQDVIVKWINQGANFESRELTTPLRDLIYSAEVKAYEVEIPKPKGDETVSFKRDIAPWVVNLCGNCHSNQRKSGGLVLETFHDMMRGGESGQVIIPGDMENSRFYRLVGGLELPRMPQGQARITRKNYEDLQQWFREGNTFDGDDPRTPLRTFLPNEASQRADQFGSLSETEMNSYRLERSQDQFKRAVPNDPSQTIETDNFILIGNTSEERLQAIQQQVETLLPRLQSQMGKEPAGWRGRLTIFLMKDRFSYDEFFQVVEQRRADPDASMHVRITPNLEEAYVVLLDTEGSSTAGVSYETQFTATMAEAYLKRTGHPVPSWLARGLSLRFAESTMNRQQIRDLERAGISSAAAAAASPETLFREGTFSTSSSGPVGWVIVKYLTNTTGQNRLANLLQACQNGQEQDAAFQAVYGANTEAVATAFFASLKVR